MAGFEVIVRPVVFPNIRPAPSRSLPPEDDPEQGFAVISGAGGSLITLAKSFNVSISKSGGTETERTYDVARIRPESGGGSTRAARAAAEDDDVFIDVEVVRQITFRDGSSKYFYTPIEESDNVEVIARNLKRST